MSERMTDPGAMHAWMVSCSVAAVLSGTAYMNTSLVSRQIPPNPPCVVLTPRNVLTFHWRAFCKQYPFRDLLTYPIMSTLHHYVTSLLTATHLAGTLSIQIFYHMHLDAIT